MTAPAPPGGPRVLVAGFGNTLRGDDGFGPAVVAELEAGGQLPCTVRAIDVGIGGLALVRELLDGYDALVLVDAVDRKGAPGSLYEIDPVVASAASLDPEARLALVDLHLITPGPALVLAKAVGALPSFVRIVGCQPADTETLTTDLTPAVRAAVPDALVIVRRILDLLGTA